jgi:NAD-dependent deacetylase
MQLPESWQKLQRIIDEAENIVFFGGAGVSTESGIPDFRSKDGLYNQQYRYPPEQIISRSFFNAQPQEFFRFYYDRVLHPEAKPNAAHLALARLEQQGKLKAVVTQNIDGLHQLAGSKEIIELHGSTLRNYCMRCKTAYDLDYVLAANQEQDSSSLHSVEMTGSDGDEADRMTKGDGSVEMTDGNRPVGMTDGDKPDRMAKMPMPHCSQAGCHGIVRPDVVLYEEPLDETVINRALYFIGQADVLIIGGTSLVVYPAASFIQYFRGSKLVIINKGETTGDSSADLVIRDSIGKVLGAVVK